MSLVSFAYLFDALRDSFPGNHSCLLLFPISHFVFERISASIMSLCLLFRICGTFAFIWCFCAIVRHATTQPPPSPSRAAREHVFSRTCLFSIIYAFYISFLCSPRRENISIIMKMEIMRRMLNRIYARAVSLRNVVASPLFLSCFECSQKTKLYLSDTDCALLPLR